MKDRPPFPLMMKMLLWLLLHLTILALAFGVFVGWQLQLGLDSLLSGASGDRLTALGEYISSDLIDNPREEWPGIINDYTEEYGVDAVLLLNGEEKVVGLDIPVPQAVLDRMHESRRMPLRPPPGPRGEHDRSRRHPPGEGPPDRPPSRDDNRPARADQTLGPTPLFLSRFSEDNGFWAGIDLALFIPAKERPLHGVLLLRSNNPSANGLFFELRPWLFGGLAVLGLSLLVWAPFIFGITRYTTRLSRTTERIARGQFDAKVRCKRRDELGAVGDSIERMAGRLDHLLRGQKRFLGDVAHELCSPLARVRTGLGILEQRLGETEKDRLKSIDEDVTELSDLVSEVLAFTRAETAPESVNLKPVVLAPLVHGAADKECPGHECEINIPEHITANGDDRLLMRAISNVLRNAHLHAGSDCSIKIQARKSSNQVVLRIEDSGKGVPESELSKLFEPFYRPDTARTREAGGAGLGMAIVRSAVEACSGSVHAEASSMGGLAVVMTLPAA